MASWEKLAEADRHWRDGMSQVAEQRARIAELERRDGDATRLRHLLAILEEAVLLTGAVRDRLLREIRMATPSMNDGDLRRPSGGGPSWTG